MALQIWGYLSRYLAKKVYGTFTEVNYTYDSEASPKRRLAAAKGNRTKTRKKLVKNAIAKNRLRLCNSLENDIKSTIPQIQTVSIELTDNRLVVDIPELSHISGTLSQLASTLSVDHHINEPTDFTVTLSALSDEVKKIVQNANSNYGDLCGIDYDDDQYDKSDDAFLKALASKN
ncbi:hypothetical protein ACUYOF_14105 [Photobacterium ganghwense]|uniref:hypothetical protein n=1 Tax=Photobacterium ganghwense TaxID=320778 RepID=UPI0040561932